MSQNSDDGNFESDEPIDRVLPPRVGPFRSAMNDVYGDRGASQLAIDLYTCAVAEEVAVRKLAYQRSQNGGTWLATRTKQEAQEWSRIADSLRPVHYEGPDN